MHEAEKIEQARYHRQQMAKVEGDPASFRHEVSAFASAARTVIQYALKEAKPKPTGEKWYEGHLAGSPLIRLFRDKRNEDIHDQPIKIPTDAEVAGEERLGVSEQFIIERFGPDGTLLQREVSPPPKPPREKVAARPVRIVYRYRFRQWPGPEDVQSLCDQLLNELRAFVADGQQRGFLT